MTTIGTDRPQKCATRSAVLRRKTNGERRRRNRHDARYHSLTHGTTSMQREAVSK